MSAPLPPEKRPGERCLPSPPDPRHSLDGPPLPFHQVLDASLKHRGRERGGWVWGGCGDPGRRGRGGGRGPGVAGPRRPDGPRAGQRPWDSASRPGWRLTFRIRRLMMDSAAKTRSPTADSSILLSGTHSP